MFQIMCVGKWTRIEDVCSIEHGGYSSTRYVGLPEDHQLLFWMVATQIFSIFNPI